MSAIPSPRDSSSFQPINKEKSGRKLVSGAKKKSTKQIIPFEVGVATDANLAQMSNRSSPQMEVSPSLYLIHSILSFLQTATPLRTTHARKHARTHAWAHTNAPPFLSLPSSQDATTIQLDHEPGHHFFAVFDGHGGKDVAQYCSGRAHQVYSSLSTQHPQHPQHPQKQYNLFQRGVIT